MAVVQKNEYEIGVNNDLSNVANNVDYNRIGTDLTTVEYNGSNVVIKAGSLIEANGSLYAVETSDIVISGNGYVAFNPSTLIFYTTSSTPTWDATKNGYYVSTTHRVTKWNIQGSITYIGERRNINTGSQYIRDESLTNGELIQTNDGILAIANNGSIFVGVGSSGVIKTSPDGITWTSRTSGTTSTFNAIVYANSLFVAVGSGGAVFTSPDGITWTNRTSGTVSTLDGIVYGESLYVAVGASNTIITSPDGTTWTSRTATGVFNDVGYGNSTFVAVGDSGVLFSSPDGITWTSRTSGTSVAIESISHNGTYFIAVGHDSTILYSTSGTSWSSSGMVSAGVVFYGVSYIEEINRFIAGSEKHISFVDNEKVLFFYSSENINSAYKANYMNDIILIPVNPTAVTSAVFRATLYREMNL